MEIVERTLSNDCLCNHIHNPSRKKFGYIMYAFLGWTFNFGWAIGPLWLLGFVPEHTA